MAPLAFPVLLLALASPWPAQVGGGWAPVARMDGPAKRDNLGWSVAPAGDLDGDGLSEIAAGAPRADLPGGGWDAGAVGLYDAHGVLLAWLPGPSAWARMGDTLDAGTDFDGDGYGDILAGAPDATGPAGGRAGAVLLYSGRTVSLLASWTGSHAGAALGSTLCFAGDWDGDGVGEVLLGAHDGFVLAGPSGSLPGSVLVGGRAADVLAAADAPRDAASHAIARPRLLLGYPQADPGGLPGAGVAVVVEPGQQPVELGGRTAGESFGQAVAFVGDLNGDGVQEFAVGAPLAAAGSRSQAGRVDLFDGASLQPVASWSGTARDDLLGLSVARAGDVDGDGIPDVLGGSGLADGGAGLATCWSGATGQVIWSHYGKGHDTKFGFALAPLDDRNGDGHDDFLVTAPGLNSAADPDAGAVLVLDRVPFLYADVSGISAAAGGTAQYSIAFTSWEGGGDYDLLFSATGTGPTWYAGQVWVPLTADSVFALSQSGAVPWTSGVSGRLDDKGRALAVFAPPPGALSAWVGQTLWAAAVADPQGRDPMISSEAVGLLVRP